VLLRNRGDFEMGSPGQAISQGHLMSLKEMSRSSSAPPTQVLNSRALFQVVLPFVFKFSSYMHDT
jgi:hypothetical protein